MVMVEKVGFVYVFILVISGDYLDDKIVVFVSVLVFCDGVVYGLCCIGIRVVYLWVLVKCKVGVNKVWL